MDRGTIPQKSQEEKVEIQPCKIGVGIRGEFYINSGFNDNHESLAA
jgi:hypothetical protein